MSRRRRCCRCPGAATPSPPDSPRTLGPPLVRTSINRHPYNTIASQIENQENEGYFNRKARERRTQQALNLIDKEFFNQEMKQVLLICLAKCYII